MNHRFLRVEAARFREMAESTDREATRVRLLAMAADYEARAKIADGLVETRPAEPAMTETGATEPNGAEADEEIAARAEPEVGKTLKLSPGRKTARGSKETVVVERHATRSPRMA